MASVFDRVRGLFAPAAPPIALPRFATLPVHGTYQPPSTFASLAAPPFIEQRSLPDGAETRAPRASAALAGGSGAFGPGHGVLEPRRGARTMRAFSEMNPWVRTAINMRKRALTRADYRIVRIDDRKAHPNPKVVKMATELFNFVNDTKMNLPWLLNMLVEDVLVVDAGVFEKELRNNGSIAALWPVPGEEIWPDPKWDGSNPRQPRYYQFRNGKLITAYTNDEMTYMMANPRTCSNVGYSPLEALFERVEAELYAAKMDYRMLRETAPAGFLYLGPGVDPKQVEAFRDQWETDIAAARQVAFFGGGDSPLDASGKAGEPKWIPLRATAREEERREYNKWLVTQIATVFEIDLLAFNLSETVSKANGGNMSAKTDQGLQSLGKMIEMYITREVVWDHIDPDHIHGFEFLGLVPRDEMADAKLDQIYMQMGATYPNEIRAKHGQDPYPGSEGDPDHWANLPYPFQQQPITEKPSEDALSEPAAGSDETDPNNAKSGVGA